MMPAMTLSTTLKAALRDQLPNLVQTLQTWPWLDTLRTLRIRFREDRLGLTATLPALPRVPKRPEV